MTDLKNLILCFERFYFKSFKNNPVFALGMVLDPVLKEKLKENRDADIETFKKFEKEEKRIKQELIKRVKEQQERERQEIKKKEEEEEKRRAAAAKEEKEKKEKEEAEKKRKEEEEKEKERLAENAVQEETSLPLSQPTTNNSVISETEDDMQTDSNQITAVTDSDIEENTDPPSTQIENQMDTSETVADQEIPADAQTDQTIPTQTDPFEPNSFASIERSVLFELPTEFATDAVRQTIMQESQRRRQIDNPANIDHTTPLVPESFLHGTNNDPLPEALITAITNLDTTERANLRRISENQANPAHIIENLDPDSRQEVLRSLPPEYLEQLPPDLINEAQNLMAASSSRRRAIRRNDNSQSRNRMTNNGYAQPIILKKPTIPKEELLKCKEQLNSIKPKTIIDEDSLVCLMTLFFIPEKTINRSCFNSILKNVLFTTETNVWIVKCLLEILHLTDSQMKSKSTVPLSSVQPAWLNYQVDMSLGQRAPVFSFFQEKTGTFYSRSGNTNEIKLVINPQACSFVDKNVLDSLFSIYKSVTNTFFWPKSETSRCTQNNSNLFKRLVKFDECIGNSEVTKVLATPKSPNSKNQSFTSSPAKQKSEPNSLTFKPVNSTADLNNTMFVDLLCMIDNSMIQSNASLMEKFLDAVTVIADQLSRSKTDEPMDDMSDEKTPLQIAIKHMVSSLVNSNMSDCSVKHLKSVLKNLSRYSKTVSNWIELELLGELRNLGIVLYKNIKVLLQEVENHNAEIGNLTSNQTNKVETPKSSTPVVQKDAKSGLTTELHLPSMQTLTSRTSVQSLFLRALKILMEVRGKKVTSNAQERRRNRNSRSVDNILEEFSFGGIPTYEEMEQMLSRVQSLNTRFNSRLFQTSSSRWNMDTRRSFSRPDSRSNEVSTNIQVLDSNSQPCQISSSWSHVNNDWMLSSGSQSTAETEITKKSVKSAAPSKFSLADELSSLQCLWETLSQCLDAFDNSGDNNAYLVIQNTVEAFFMVHSLETSKEDKKKSNQMTASTTSEMFVDPELPKETRAFLKFADKHRTVLNQVSL